jgi:chromosome segregation ATPase
MKKISIVGVLVEGANWVLHPLANYKELQDYRKDYDKEVLGFRNTVENLKEKIEIEKSKYDTLEKQYVKYRARLSETERALSEYTKAFPSDLHNYLDMQSKFEDLEKENNLQDDEIRGMKATIRTLEQKVIYRNNVITGLRNDKRDLREEIKSLKEQLAKARNEVLTLAKKVEFYEKQAKKTPKEKVDYLMKRGKKNES